MNLFRKVSAFFLDLIETIVMALAVFVVIYLFLFQPHQVRGNSMYPNFHDGEYILTDKISYRVGEPKRGDVVIFKAPRNEEYDYIKRIIGLPGETIKISSNQIIINNTALPESYLDKIITSSGSFLRPQDQILVPENNFFVLGDNRSHSSDSREWGFVPKENIIGKAWLRYWPPPAFGIVPAADYSSLGRTNNSLMNLLQPILGLGQMSFQPDAQICFYPRAS